MSKKKDKKRKKANKLSGDIDAVVEQLRSENQELRDRLEQIAVLARVATPGFQPDEEDAEYEELSRDVDDQIAETEPAAT
jgi:hypothetical protein